MSVVERGRGDRGWQGDLEAHDVLDSQIPGIPAAPGGIAACRTCDVSSFPITLLLPTF